MQINDRLLDVLRYELNKVGLRTTPLFSMKFCLS